MANNFQVSNPYTSRVPGGTLTKVQLTQPNSVQIAWPNTSGGNVVPKGNFVNRVLQGMFK
jgi:hypothetical protein